MPQRLSTLMLWVSMSNISYYCWPSPIKSGFFWRAWVHATPACSEAFAPELMKWPSGHIAQCISGRSLLQLRGQQVWPRRLWLRTGTVYCVAIRKEKNCCWQLSPSPRSRSPGPSTTASPPSPTTWPPTTSPGGRTSAGTSSAYRVSPYAVSWSITLTSTYSVRLKSGTRVTNNAADRDATRRFAC